jgi:hypothetical protein
MGEGKLSYRDKGFLAFTVDRLALIRERHWEEANRWRMSVEPNDHDATYKQRLEAAENAAASELSDVITMLMKYGESR